MDEEELKDLIKRAQKGDEEATELILTKHRKQVSCGTFRNGAINALSRSFFPPELKFARQIFLEEAKLQREAIEDQQKPGPITTMLADITVTHFAANQLYSSVFFQATKANPKDPSLTDKSRRLNHMHGRFLRTVAMLRKYGNPS